MILVAKKNMLYYVYYLKSIKYPKQRYVGYSTNLNKRFKEHNQGLSLSTKPYRP
ncbi:MAG: GIY-YIG nuclease family protein [Patescibacteria group bacterium]|nr:GIY-YIG nuclease family protein [Patescibacteria group bacterium]